MKEKTNLEKTIIELNNVIDELKQSYKLLQEDNVIIENKYELLEEKNVMLISERDSALTDSKNLTKKNDTLTKDILNYKDTVQDLHRLREQHYNRVQELEKELLNQPEIKEKIVEVEKIVEKEIEVRTKELLYKYDMNDIVFYQERYSNMPFKILELQGHGIEGALYRIHSFEDDISLSNVSEYKLQKANQFPNQTF